MKNTGKVLIGLVLTATVVAANAAEKGFYVEGNVGTNSISSEGNGVREIASSGIGVNGNAGYSFNRYLALEGGYTVHHDSSATLHTLHAAGKATLPFGESGFKMFGKLGLGVVFDRDYSEAGPYAGLGFAYEMNDKFDLNVQSQATYLSKNEATLGLVSTGITYHFG